MKSGGQIELAIELLSKASRMIALTGAGISTPSGIPDFRSPNSGLWKNVDPMEVASIYSFRRRPQAFFDWIHPLARLMLDAKPNPAHLALAQMEEYGPLCGVITQNIDMLHHKAGSKVVYEVHGHLREVTCIDCFTLFPTAPFLGAFVETGKMPSCDLCGGVLKPNVVLFGEQLPVRLLDAAKRQLRTCDLMLVAGTSLEIAPAGDLPLLAYESGARIIIVNREPTYIDYLADVVIHEDVVEVLPVFAGSLMGKFPT